MSTSSQVFYLVKIKTLPLRSCCAILSNVTGDYSAVVGYGAVVILKEK
jgi:hypothetical protein